MGRPYTEDLLLLTATWQWAQSADISILERSLTALRGRPLLVVGSGGSLSACTFAARLHETHARLPARVLTPLELLRHPVPQAAGVLLLSAGGNNPDILAAARHAVVSEYSPVVGLCTRADTRLKALLSPHRHSAVFEFAGPSPKDGFLATSSLLLTCALLLRAYGMELPARLTGLDPALWEPEVDLALLSRANVIALADGWATAAAVDLESKWAESGFGSVVVTDARNFAHGRHHGLSRRLAETLVVGLAVAEEDGLTSPRDVLSSTLARLPRSAAVLKLESPLPAEAGALDLLVRVIRLAGEAGRRTGLDPGKPRVPAFGRALYRAGIPRSLAPRTAVEAPAEDLWIRRKVTPALWAAATEKDRACWRASCRAWVKMAESARVGGVVLDYDGTLCEAAERFGAPTPAVGAALARLLKAGMVVGVATGRGSSVIDALRRIVPERVWPEILVGLYNGGTLLSLHEEQPEPSGGPEEPILHAFEILSRSPLLGRLIRLRQKPRQLSVEAERPLPEGLLRRLIHEALSASPALPVEILASDHSVDIVVQGVSKLCVVAEAERRLTQSGRTGLAILTIGDQGQEGGNDARFLARPLGLSVEHASSTFEGCWNVAPAGARRTAALLGYLGALRRHADGSCRWSAARASRSVRGRAAKTAGLPEETA